jgi:hypothetical protein
LRWLTAAVRRRRPGSGGHEDAEGLAVSAAARFDELVAAEDFTDGADGVEGVALSAASPWWAFGAADLDDAFALSDKEFGEACAVAAGAFHGPAPLVR